jgi:hypothetical protein
MEILYQTRPKDRYLAKKEGDKMEDEVERRYWVSCPALVNDSFISGIELEAEEDQRLKKLQHEVEEVFEWSDEANMVYKTRDLKDAKEQARFARRLLKEAFDDDDILVNIQIVAQPECAKCGELGRFADSYCSSCGAELLPKEYVDF